MLQKDRLDTSRVKANTSSSRSRLSNPTSRNPESFHHLRGGDGLAAQGTALSGAQVGVLAGDGGIGLLDHLLTLGQDQLDVAGVGHVGVDLRSKVSHHSMHDVSPG